MTFSAKIVIMRHLRKMKLVLLLSQMNLRMPTSTRQVPDKLHTDNANVKQLVSAINGRQLSVREMLSEMGLKYVLVFADSHFQFFGKDGNKIGFLILMNGNDERWINQLAEPDQILLGGMTGCVNTVFYCAAFLAELLHIVK